MRKLKINLNFKIFKNISLKKCEHKSKKLILISLKNLDTFICSIRKNESF